ncbi:hypothetical protein [Arthrobacter sp. B2a2-09]|uniref:hypothetical protein n=1 Tax=Arthrobacter sp. B2a2-09 TaxID=2952822 RepID=UPI0022CD4889|nr:hypothetical protein [Arthrobacter sp. B2a2-09]
MIATVFIAAPAQAGTAQRNTPPQEREDPRIRADTGPGVQPVAWDQGLSPGRSPSPLHESAKKYDGVYVMDGNAPGTTLDGGATFYPLPAEAEGALIVTPEVARDLHLKPGEVPVSQVGDLYALANSPETSGSISSPSVQAVSPMAATSHYTSFWAPLGGSWSNEIRRLTSYSHVSEKYYGWNVAPIAIFSVCTQGTGYYTGYNGGSFGLWKRWYGTGCGKSGSTRVPWDNVLAYPTFMARSMVVYAGVPGQFR